MLQKELLGEIQVLPAIHYPEDQIGIKICGSGGSYHITPQNITALMNPRGIDKYNLPLVRRQNTADHLPGSLRLGRDNRQILPDQTIEQRRLPNIRLTGKTDKTGTGLNRVLGGMYRSPQRRIGSLIIFSVFARGIM